MRERDACSISLAIRFNTTSGLRVARRGASAYKKACSSSRRSSMKPIKTILCPTDFSESSQAALSVALDLATRLGSRIDLVHILHVPIYVGWEDSPAGLAATAQLLEESRARVQQQLEATAKEYAARGVPTSVHQYEGTPHQKIAELSKDADLVVLGTHGRTGLPHLLLGSVAERVVRTAHCPVMTVPLRKAT
jgi:universal stress protein A